MSRRVLHVLSQRPSLTGSGITLDALVRLAAGWDQRVACGVPASDPRPFVGGLDPDCIRPLVFETDAIPFPVPGMSDVMPYPSSVFSTMTADQLATYRRAWSGHLSDILASFVPDVVHSHHVWILSALLKDLTDAAVVTHCHATGLRQMELCPHLADEVRAGCARNDAFVVLTAEHRDRLCEALGVEQNRVHVVGAGYRQDLFHDRGRTGGGGLLYVGKYSEAKGLPWLLDALEKLPGVHLHVAGAGAGTEARSIGSRMRSMEQVTLHGQLDQASLADLMRACDIMVLPSFYEGIPLVLVEAAACGCRLVSTALPGIVENLAPHLGDTLTLVDPPRLSDVDIPDPRDLPAFVDDLARAVESTCELPPLETSAERLEPFTWRAVFASIERVWEDVRGA